MDTKIYWWVLLIVIITAIPAIVLSYLRRQMRVRAWEEIATRTGLTVEADSLLRPPRVTGEYRRHALTLYTYTRHHTRHRHETFTRITLTVDNRAGIRMELYDEHIFSGVAKSLGAQDIQIGDEEIDRRFMIKGQPKEAIVRLLDSPSLRQELLAMRRLKIVLSGQDLWCEVRGELWDADYIQSLFDLLSDLAERVEKMQAGIAITETK